MKKLENQEFLCPVCDAKAAKNVDGKTKLLHEFTKYDEETGEPFTDKKFWKKFVGKNGVTFCLREGVFLKPKNRIVKDKSDKDTFEEYDHKRYPEKYRKGNYEFKIEFNFT